LYQNFLVIRGGDDNDRKMYCPTDVAANPANRDFVDTNTLLHQNGQGDNNGVPPTVLVP
jgi:hypothetical protein